MLDDDDTPKKQREEDRLVRKLLATVAEGLNRSPITQQDMKDRTPEVKAIVQVLERSGINESLMIGVLGAFVFRQTRLAIALRRHTRKWQQQQQSTTTSSYRLDPVGEPLTNPLMASNSVPPPSTPPPRPPFPLRLLGFLGDFSVGWFIAGGAMTLYYLPRFAESIFDSFEEMPLIEGRSRIAEGCCDDIVAELQKHLHPSSDDDEYDFDHPVVHTLTQFAVNCQRRRAYEEELRRDQGLAPDAVVLVPAPGVPSDYSILDGNDNGWIESLTTDQGQEARTNKKKWW